MHASNAKERWFGPATDRQRALCYAVALLCLGTAAVVLGRLRAEPAFSVDDAYITLHNAQALLARHDERFVGTPALVGATSSIHVVLIACFLLFLKPLWAQFVVGCLGAIAYGLGLLRLAFVMGASVLQALLVLVAGMFIGEAPHQLLNGLETGWAMASLVLALAAASERPCRRQWELPVLAGVMPFFRPELIVVTMLLVGLRVWDLWRARTSNRAGLVAGGRCLAYLLAAMAPWLLLSWIMTGIPWPTTIGAKQYFFAEQCYRTKAQIVGDALLHFGHTIGVLALVAPLLLISRIGRAFGVFAMCFVLAYYLRFPGALNHYEQRYLYIIVPGLLFAPLPLIRWHRTVGQITCAVLFLLCIYRSERRLADTWNGQEAGIRFTVTELGGVASWVNQNVPPNARVLVHDVGYVGFATHVRLFDLVGLKTPSSSLIHKRLSWATCGRRRRDAVALIAAMDLPGYLIVSTGWNRLYGFTGALTDAGWKLELLRPGAYQVYKLTPPDSNNHLR